jgi:hypothetical protein
MKKIKLFLLELSAFILGQEPFPSCARETVLQKLEHFSCLQLDFISIQSVNGSCKLSI